MILYFIPKTTEDWDSFLSERFGYGIYEFSFTVAYLIILRNPKYQFPPRTRLPKLFETDSSEYAKDLIKKITNLKSHIINRLYDYSTSFEWLDCLKRPTEKKINDITEIYDLDPFFKHLDEQIERLNFLKYISGKKAGRQTEIRNIIAYIWAEVMKDKKERYWPLIEGLLLWFYYKLEKTKYRETLGHDNIRKTDFDRFYLRNAYYRMKKNEKKREALNFFRYVCFPTPKDYPRTYIKFNKEHIDFGMRRKGGPMLRFPSGESYRAGY